MINIHTNLLTKVDENEMWLLIHIAKRLGKKMMCFPSNSTLMKDTGWGIDKLRDTKKSLVEKKLITIHQKKGTSNDYKVKTSLIGVFISAEKLSGDGKNRIPQSEKPIPISGENQSTPPLENPTDKYYSDEVLSTEELKRNKSAKNALEDFMLPFGSDQFKDAWELWVQHRKEIKKKLTPTSVKLQFKQLAAKNETEAIAMIKKAIEKGWTGLYELEEKDKVPKIDELSSMTKSMMNTFEGYYEIKTTFSFTWNRSEDIQGIDCLSKIFAKRLSDKKHVPTDENVTNAFSQFLPMMPNHYQKRSLNPEMIYKNFNNIINEITHGSNSTQQSTASQYV
jgi:hypothetical protein